MMERLSPSLWSLRVGSLRSQAWRDAMMERLSLCVVSARGVSAIIVRRRRRRHRRRLQRPSPPPFGQAQQGAGQPHRA